MMQTSMTIMDGHYVPQEVLGNGTYGCVLLCVDTRSGEQVAVKISQREAAYRRSAIKEIQVLQLLAHNEESLNMLDFFEENERFCIVSELLRTNFYELLRAHGFQPLSLDAIRIAGERVLKALSELHSLGYIHCDIKPENVMLRPSDSDSRNIEDFTKTCLIDFGAVRHFHENTYYDVQSLWYRAPEVLLGIPYTPLIDSWSLGCLLFELYTGKPLFPGENPQEQINNIVCTLGLPSMKAMTLGANITSLQVPKNTKGINAEANLHCLIKKYRYNSGEVQPSCSLSSSSEEVAFVNLLCKLLQPDESLRMSCTDALYHVYFSHYYSQRKDTGNIVPSPLSVSSNSFMPTGECNFSGGLSPSGSDIQNFSFHEHVQQQQQQQQKQQSSTIIPLGSCNVVPLMTFVGNPPANMLPPPPPTSTSNPIKTTTATTTTTNASGVAIAPPHVFLQNIVYQNTSASAVQPVPFHIQPPHAECLVNSCASSMANTPTKCLRSFQRPSQPQQQIRQQNHCERNWNTTIAPSRMIAGSRCNQQLYNGGMVRRIDTDHVVYQAPLMIHSSGVIYAP
ncbi:Protein kinase domain [Trypanosoma melophagium]|uniref:Protein kinase domain n=1 Tax=Trypanosoma melophagium TaxID=715481 RepID=UPI00351A0475|nr:Protein kinase domain [Trypanosoma melophagium]